MVSAARTSDSRFPEGAFNNSFQPNRGFPKEGILLHKEKEGLALILLFYKKIRIEGPKIMQV
jgi:hypothetical protein